MPKYIVLLLAILFFSADTYAKGDETLDCSLIPPALLKHADAVVRRSSQEVRIVSLDEIYETETYAITILNKDGYDYARLGEYYNKFSTINSIEGTLYDKDGKEVRSLKKVDIRDAAVVSAPNLFDDSRVKYCDFNYSVYPFTVEFEIEKRTNISFFLPAWYPQKSHKCAVEKSDFSIEYPTDLPLRYRAFHLNKEHTDKKDGNMTTMIFSVGNIAARKEDKLAPLENFPLPTLIFATDSFEFGGLSGKMDTWKSFGKFFYDLNDKRQDLPAETKIAVHKLVDTCSSTFNKISLLYKYLQSGTRYVSIQLGMGGWQCFPADFVAEKGYGDCKALSNYMKALLKEAGISSDMVLVYGGKDNSRKLLTDFPFSSFNHAILCVPSEKDTVWLECTSKDLPAGYLSDFTHDRDVLMLTPDGGVVVKTPTYNYSDNHSTRVVYAHIDDKDQVDAKIRKEIRGSNYVSQRHELIDQPKEKVEDYLNRQFSLNTYKVNDYKISTSLNGRIPTLSEQISLTGSGKITHAGKRMFIDPDIFQTGYSVPEENEKREKPFYIRESFETDDSEVVKLDGAYTAEYVPGEINMTYSFGAYNYKIFFENDNTIKLVRTYRIVEGTYDASMFADYVKFMKAFSNATEQKQLVLLKKD